MARDTTRMSHSLVEKQDPRLSGESEEFNKKNPGSTIVQLSRVAFDPAMTQALVYLSFTDGISERMGFAADNRHPHPAGLIQRH